MMLLPALRPAREPAPILGSTAPAATKTGTPLKKLFGARVFVTLIVALIPVKWTSAPLMLTMPPLRTLRSTPFTFSSAPLPIRTRSPATFSRLSETLTRWPFSTSIRAWFSILMSPSDALKLCRLALFARSMALPLVCSRVPLPVSAISGAVAARSAASRRTTLPFAPLTSTKVLLSGVLLLASGSGPESVSEAGVPPAGPPTPDTNAILPLTTTSPETPAVRVVSLSLTNGEVDVLLTLAPLKMPITSPVSWIGADTASSSGPASETDAGSPVCPEVTEETTLSSRPVVVTLPKGFKPPSSSAGALALVPFSWISASGLVLVSVDRVTLSALKSARMLLVVLLTRGPASETVALAVNGPFSPESVSPMKLPPDCASGPASKTESTSWMRAKFVVATSWPPCWTLNPVQQADVVPRLVALKVLPLIARNSGPARSSRVSCVGERERRTTKKPPEVSTVAPSYRRNAGVDVLDT